MKENKVCYIAFVGGSCGATMVRVAGKLTELCEEERLKINVRYVDLWVSDYLMPNIELVVEMMPYYKNLDIPIVNGRGFLSHVGEDKLYENLVEKIRKLSKLNDG